MTNEQLKKLQDDLWDSANSLRAYGGLKASDYAVPVLGLIFLKFADNKYSLFEEEIKAEFEKKKGKRDESPLETIAISKCGFYLPKFARYDFLLNLSGDKSMAKALQKAMKGIEQYQDEKFQDVLPTQAYFEIEKKKDDILPSLLKTFSDISKDASGDLFGKIYEYFLGKFAMSEGQKGGQFYTPTSVVRFIVEVIEPYSGQLYDPACGSGGMFVQSATFLRNAKKDLSDIYVCGQEFMGETVRLGKMNLLVNNLRGEIAEVNSYATDYFESFGKFDYVMANPPFNVKSVKESTVNNDPRFYTYGLPKNKGKKDDKISDANYLWVSLFATSLNEKGRAGFVMPNSASDARNAEYEIRKKIVDSGIVDCMVSMPSNMFFTVTLPATLWFFDKAKVQTDRKDKILFLDARNVYHQIDRAHREWTEEHQQNLATIVRLYRGEKERFTDLIDEYIKKEDNILRGEDDFRFTNFLSDLHFRFETWIKDFIEVKKNLSPKFTDKQTQLAEDFCLDGRLKTLRSSQSEIEEIKTQIFAKIDNYTYEGRAPYTKAKTHKAKVKAQQELVAIISTSAEQLRAYIQKWKSIHADIEALILFFDKKLKLGKEKTYQIVKRSLEESIHQPFSILQNDTSRVKYFLNHILWLQERFPNGVYRDVIGLCKVANREEYVEEQDYSLNAGRYVGVVVEDENITKEEFNTKLKHRLLKLQELNKKASFFEKSIGENLETIINE